MVKRTAQLTFRTEDASGRIEFAPGASVREILDAAGIRIRSGCRGNGACGLCLVQVEAGAVNDLTKNEQLLLTADQIERSTRLACHLKPEDDLTVRILIMASRTGWRDLAPGRFSPAFSAGSSPADDRYGLAVDLGTTHISVSLWEMNLDRRRSGRTGANPQYCYGADVVTRMIAASESRENARRLACMPLYAVNEALMEMCSQEGVDPEKVARVAIVGNTAMLTLLTETDPGLLLQPHSWTQPIACREDRPRNWADVLGVSPEAYVEVVSPFAGFVGSDLLAGALAVRLTDRPGSLLIDFGTNSEIALWDGETLRVTSAAGGPAFEGCGMQCGMPAEPGAIYRAELDRESSELRVETLEGGQARGICGSGLVDVIACLRRSGDLTPTGKFKGSHSRVGFVIQREPMIRMTHGDVDILQRAKAAIGVGIKTLLAGARMSAADLNRICVCGAFGEHLNVRNAQEIGLLPDVSPELIELCGNTALAGCERLLVSPEGAAELEALRRRATIINLSQSAAFEDLFLESLYLSPLRTDPI